MSFTSPAPGRTNFRTPGSTSSSVSICNRNLVAPGAPVGVEPQRERLSVRCGRRYPLVLEGRCRFRHRRRFALGLVDFLDGKDVRQVDGA